MPYMITENDIVWLDEELKNPNYKAEEGDLGYEAWYLIKNSEPGKTRELVIRLWLDVGEVDYVGQWPENRNLLLIYTGFVCEPESAQDYVLIRADGGIETKRDVSDCDLSKLIESLEELVPNQKLTVWYFNGETLSEEKELV